VGLKKLVENATGLRWSIVTCNKIFNLTEELRKGYRSIPNISSYYNFIVEGDGSCKMKIHSSSNLVRTTCNMKVTHGVEFNFQNYGHLKKITSSF